MTVPFFETAFRLIVGEEGVLSMDPRDPGNWTGGVAEVRDRSGKVISPGVGLLKGTKYGISAKAYPSLNIAAIDLPAAHTLYIHDYWSLIRGDDLPQALALILMDCAINQGVHAARDCLQLALEVAADGILGPVTMSAVKSADPRKLLIEVAARRGLRYASGDIDHEGLGWYRRLARIFALSLSTGSPT